MTWLPAHGCLPSAIRSYGLIDALVEAAGSGGWSDGGQIGTVTARGTIAGQLTAASKITALEAGSTITATALAPEVGPRLELDAELASLAAAAAPAGLDQKLFDDLAKALAGLQSDRATEVQSRQTLLNQAATDRRKVLGDLAQQQFNAQLDTFLAYGEALVTWGLDLVTANLSQAADLAAAEKSYNSGKKTVDKTASRLADKVVEIKTSRNQEYTRTAGIVASATAELSQLDNEMADTVAQATGRSQKEDEAAATTQANDIAHRIVDGVLTGGFLPLPPEVAENALRGQEASQRRYIVQWVSEMMQDTPVDQWGAQVEAFIQREQRSSTPLSDLAIRDLRKWIAEEVRIRSRIDHNRQVLAALRSAQKPGPEARRRALMRDFADLLQAAREYRVPAGRDECERWAQGFIAWAARKPSPDFKLKLVVWTYKFYKYFPEWWRLRHAAVRVNTADGRVFYLDNGWWGGSDHFFLPDDIPHTVYEGR